MSDQSQNHTETLDQSLNGTGPTGQSSIPTTGVEGKPLQPPSWPVMGALVAAIAAVLWLVRAVGPRKRPPTKSERLTEAGQALGAAAVGLGARAAKRTAAASEPVAKDAAEAAAKAAAAAAKNAGKVGAAASKNAGKLTAAAAKNAGMLSVEAAETAGKVAAVAAGSAGKVAGVAAEGAHELAEGVEAVQKGWHKLVTRLIIVVFGSIGYVLGARAGRERYDQIAGAAKSAWQTAQGMRG